MKCYACENPGKPRSIGGTEYYLCDSCYQTHAINNWLAVAVLQAQLIREETNYEAI